MKPTFKVGDQVRAARQILIADEDEDESFTVDMGEEGKVTEVEPMPPEHPMAPWLYTVEFLLDHGCYWLMFCDAEAALEIRND